MISRKKIKIIRQRGKQTHPVDGMDKGSAFKILTGKPSGKRPFGRPKRRWEDNIRMDLEEIGINGLIRLRIGIIGEPL